MKAKSKNVKRYIKLLSILHEPIQQKAILKKAPDGVIKSICDAALNAQRGEIHLSRSAKKKFAAQRVLFNSLISRKVSIPKKRSKLIQRGGLAILPILLSTVLSSLGNLLFSK